jgi:hypothetical protein
MIEKDIHLFKNVNKNGILQCKFINMGIIQYNLNNKKLLTVNT